MFRRIVYNATALMLTSSLIVLASYTLAYFILLLQYGGN